MIPKPDEQIIVFDLAGRWAKVSVKNESAATELLKIGFVPDDDDLVFEISNEQSRQSVTLALINLQALFSSGPGWSPAELVAYYRDRGLVTGRYRTISWRGPDEYLIRDE